MDAKKSPQEALAEAKALLHRMAHGQASKTDVTRALGLLDIIARGINEGASVERRSRRGNTTVRYIVERSPLGETLAEQRETSGSPTFRCPRALYQALVEVLARAPNPLSLEEITTEVEAVMGVRPPEHQLRVPIRLFLHREPPLLTRTRARYRAFQQSDFTRVAHQLWSILRRREPS